MFGKRILILVPHPDDEIVACGATLGRAKTEGAEIYALYLTHGCIDAATLWPWQRKKHKNFVATRRAEAHKVADFLEITPIGWSSRSARHLWNELPQVYGEIQTAITAHDIDQLWVPAYEGGNPDHDGLNAVGKLFAQQISVLEFAEYNFSGGKTRSQEFPHPNGTEQIVTLTSAEQNKKRAALTLYKSEQQNLNYVDVQRECYRPLAIYDYNCPPHEGPLWYARFQWVPFRHPRVDFTKPSEVSAAITAFLNSTTTAPLEPATR